MMAGRPAIIKTNAGLSYFTDAHDINVAQPQCVNIQTNASALLQRISIASRTACLHFKYDTSLGKGVDLVDANRIDTRYAVISFK